MTPTSISFPENNEDFWPFLLKEAAESRSREPELARLLGACVADRASFSDALAYVLAESITNPMLDAAQLRAVFSEIYKAEPRTTADALTDLRAVIERDPAATSLLAPFLFFKGFHALQIYRAAHWLWKHDRKALALYLQSTVSRRLSIDIHPAAIIGNGIMMDHAHGIVIGETAVVEDNVSFMHEVTLGGSYTVRGDRHPKIRTGVMLGAGAKILGNVEIGQGTRVATGSVVVKNVPPHVTVAGVPARIVGSAGSDSPAHKMDQIFSDEGSSI